MKVAILGVVALMATTTFVNPSVADEQSKSIVLVHGAFVDASGWKDVFDILTGEGYEVLVVQNPTESLVGDVAAAKAVIAMAKHPVVLVGHSYGGAVITQAGADPRVESLVYLAAFAPDVGETVYQLATAPTPGEEGAPLLPPSDGFIIVDPARFAMAFASDVDDPALTRFMAASQVPWGLPALQTPLTDAAWSQKPSAFLITTNDHMVQPSIQKAGAMRAGGTVREIDSSHAVMLSHPEDVAAFITEAAARLD